MPREHDWVAQVRRLESEVAGLRRGMRTRGLIEQAKGMIAERLGIDPEEAFHHLSHLSQQTNVRLVDVAADLVGAPRSQPQIQNQPQAEPPTTPSPPPGPSSPVPPPLAPPSTSPPATLSRPVEPIAGAVPADATRTLRRLASAATAATNTADLADAVVEAVSCLRAKTVALFGLQPSGGQRLLCARGWPASLIDDWERVPSAVVIPANEAARLRRPVWLDGFRETHFTLIGAEPRRAVLPLEALTRCVGVLEIGWAEAAALPEPHMSFLAAVALTVGPALAAMIAPWAGQQADLRSDQRAASHAGQSQEDEPPEGLWLRAALEALPAPAQLLSPVRDASGAVSDFVIDYANAETSAAQGGEARPTVVGRRLLDTDPDLVDNGVLDAYVRAFDGGEPIRLDPADDTAADGRRLVRRSATRLGDRLLVTSQAVETDAVLGEQGIRMEILGEFGWGEWRSTFEPVAWSPGLFHLLGRAPARGPVSLSRVLSRVVPDDVAVAEAMVRTVLQDGKEASAEIRLDRDGEIRNIRLVAEARFDPRRRPVAILALLQDVTETRRRDQQLSRRETQLAAQRIHSAAEQAYTDELRRLLYPPAEDKHADGRLTLRARHIAPKSIQRFRGDFYDIVEVSGGVVLILGDVFGSGVSAATTMVRLRHAARALGLAGVDPGQALNLLNGELARDDEPPLASLVVARFTHEDGTMAWAQAGHFAPALIRAGRTRSLVRPAGIALGLASQTRYEEARVNLRPCDFLVFYTDGVLSGLDAVADPVAHLVRGFGATYREGGPSSVFDHYLRPAEDEACVVTAEISG